MSVQFSWKKGKEITKLAYQSETDNFILPDVNVQDFNLKTEPTVGIPTSTELGVESSCGSEFTPGVVKLEPPELDSSTVTPLQTLESEMTFEVYSTTYPQVTKLAYQSETDNFILPDIKVQDLNLKTEPPVGIPTSTELGLGSSLGSEFPPNTMKLEPPDLDPSPMQSLESEVTFEVPSTTDPQDFLDAPKIAPKQIKIKNKFGQNGPTIVDQGLQNMNSNNCLKHNCKIGRNSTIVKYDALVLRCLHCQESFNCWEDLEKHHLNHERVHIVNKCNHCGKTFTEISNLKNHLEMHSFGKPNKLAPLNPRNKEKRHKCSICGSTFHFKSELVQHVLRHTGIKPYKCSHCEKSFYTRSALKKHFLLTSEEKFYQCDICGKAFALKNALTKHVRIHTIEKRHKCHICKTAFIWMNELRVHLMRHSKEQPHKCKQCGRGYTRKCDLKVHVMTHSQVKPDKRPHCGKGFTTTNDLNRHTLVHSEETPNECKSASSTHLARQAGIKPYKCSHCEMCFPTKTALNRHLSASGIKAFQCDHCGKAFRFLSNLIKHARRHTEERPYKCSQCEKAYPWANELKVHLMKHSEEKPHKCTQCGKGFYRISELNRHAVVHFKEEPHKS